MITPRRAWLSPSCPDPRPSWEEIRHPREPWSAMPLVPLPYPPPLGSDAPPSARPPWLGTMVRGQPLTCLCPQLPPLPFSCHTAWAAPPVKTGCRLICLTGNYFTLAEGGACFHAGHGEGQPRPLCPFVAGGAGAPGPATCPAWAHLSCVSPASTASPSSRVASHPA